jgi:hypothetical protein
MNPLRVVLSIFAGLAMSTSAFSDELIYSHEFVHFIAYDSGSPQFEDWLSFRASLPESGVMSITISGSRDPEGRTCSDPETAQRIADAMFMGAIGEPNFTITLSEDCDGFTWNTGSCSAVSGAVNNLELNVGPLRAMCLCSTDSYTIRPGISENRGGNSSWGGISGATCNAPTQTMTVTVNVISESEPDTDGDDVPDSNDLCPATAPAAEVDVHGCSDAQVDGDGDGICDPDAPSGGPSACTGIDAFPDDPSESGDNDGDGIGDNTDDDDDNDGQTDDDELACNSDPLDDRSMAPDADNDGVPDCVDADDDNDLVADDIDVCQATAIPEAVPTSSRGLGRNRWRPGQESLDARQFRWLLHTSAATSWTPLRHIDCRYRRLLL